MDRETRETLLAVALGGGLVLLGGVLTVGALYVMQWL